MTNHTSKYWISTHEAIPIQTRMILNEYLLSLKLANKAETTISKYRSILERFCSECLVPLSSLTSKDVLKWVNKFSIGKKESTMIIILSILSSFFKSCLAEDLWIVWWWESDGCRFIYVLCEGLWRGKSYFSCNMICYWCNWFRSWYINKYWHFWSRNASIFLGSCVKVQLKRLDSKF